MFHPDSWPEEYRDWSAEQIEDAQKTTEATEDAPSMLREGFTREGFRQPTIVLI